MKSKKILSLLVAVSVLLTSVLCASTAASAKSDFDFSEEYKSSPFYSKLMTALEETEGKTAMERTLAAALSQEGYNNYATQGIDLEQARADGLLWTGKELRMNSSQTGNTEYTRWAQRYVMNRAESTQYEDIDWCAIFVSWCMYQAGYYDKEQLKQCYYSYYATSADSFDADSWITSFNLNQEKVWYTANAAAELENYYWNTYYNTECDPFELPYKPGGLLFFNWDGDGGSFDHVAIVVSYDKDTHVLTYTNGNSGGQVITRQIDLDVEEEFRGTRFTKNANRIVAYGEYDKIEPFEQRTINCEIDSITWDKEASSGIRFQTDSKSKVFKAAVDGEYLGSNIESNMILQQGKVIIGKSEIKNLPVGDHTLTITFDDGVLNLPFRITNGDEPFTTEPATTEPVTTEPVTTEPTTTEPVTTEPVTTEPATTEPVTTEPVTTEPTTEPETVTPKLNFTKKSLSSGKTAGLTVTDGKAKDWVSTNTNVATVRNGKVTALRKGTATVYALLDNGTYLSCKVSVTTSPKLSKSSITVKKGKTKSVTITGKASTVNNVYTNTKIAKIISKSSASTIKVKGLKKGSTTLKLRVNGFVLKLKVKVN